MNSPKERLIEATFQEVYTYGYNGASLNNILKNANVKKGTMYHYFSSKKQMVLEMIETIFEKSIIAKWELLQKNNNENSIDLIIKTLQNSSVWDLQYGCPLGNLLQETLDFDEEFKIVLDKIVTKWKTLFCEALQKDRKVLKDNINIEQCATFIIASIEGAILISKKTDDSFTFKACMNELSFYLNTLKK